MLKLKLKIEQNMYSLIQYYHIIITINLKTLIHTDKNI